LANADENVFLWLNGFVGRFEPFDAVVRWVVSDYLVPVSLALALVGLWFVGKDRLTRQKHQIGVFVALASMGFSSLSVYVINMVYKRPRPFEGIVDEDISLLFYEPTDWSFPSNAVAAAFGIALGVWGVNRRLGTVLVICASLYGFARVYGGVHYPLDVIGGVAIAVVITYLVFKLRDLLDPIPTWAVKLARIFCLA